MNISTSVRRSQTAIVEENIPKTGVGGQEKKRAPLATFLLAVCLIAGCAAADRERSFTGPHIARAGTCDPAATAVLTIRHQAIAFAPDAGTLVLRGTADTTGDLAADLTLAGIDHKPYRLLFNAREHGATITGTYITPRCRYDVTLRATAE